MLARRLAWAWVAFAAVAGCSASGSPKPNGADKTFLQDMISHHQRAIAVAQIGLAQARDPRVHAFAQRIVDEQSPELSRMRSRVADTHLTIDAAAGARMAMNRITDTQLSALAALHGAAFDKQFLALNVSSEQGAAAMARTELAHGVDAPARKLAKAIANAPTSEIPELRALLADLS